MKNSGRFLIVVMLGTCTLLALIFSTIFEQSSRGGLAPGAPHTRGESEAQARRASPTGAAGELRNPTPAPAALAHETRPKATVAGSSVPTPPGKTASGWVLDPTGRPVEGARITSWRTSGLSKCLDSARTVVTSNDGHFEVIVDFRGAACLAVEHPDYTLWNGPLPEELPATIRLQAPLSLRGRVLSARGRPALGSTVQFNTPGLRSARRRIPVDEFGQFEIEGLRRGSLLVWVSGPHGSLGPAELQVGEEEPALLQLSEIRSIKVRIEDADRSPLSGVRVVLVHPKTGRALESTRTGHAGEVIFPAATASSLCLKAEHPNYRFEIHKVPSGDREITLRSLPCGSLALTSGADASLLVDLSRVATEEPERIRLVVPAKGNLHYSPLTPGIWKATWSSLLSGGRDLSAITECPYESGAGTEFTIAPNQETRLHMGVPPTSKISGSLSWSVESFCAVELRSIIDDAPLARTEIDEGGSFLFGGLCPGRYLLTLCAEGGGRWRDPRAFTVEPGEELVVSLDPGSSTCLIVARTREGQPLSSASARLRGDRVPFAGGNRFDSNRLSVGSATLPAAGADELGRIRLELLPPDGSIVFVHAPGFSPGEIEIPAGAIRIDAVLSRR